MRQHLDTIAIVQLVWGGLQLGLTAFMTLPGLMYAGMGVLMVILGIAEGDEEALISGVVVGAFSLIMFIPVLLFGLAAALSFATGYGIIKRKPWVRMPGVIGGALATMQCFPIGALVGVFTIIVLLDRDVAAELELNGAAELP